MAKKMARSQRRSKPASKKATPPARTARTGSAKRPATTRTGPSRKGSVPTIRPEAIAVRAYHIYLERGSGHGRDLEDWLQAERELRGLTQLLS